MPLEVEKNGPTSNAGRRERAIVSRLNALPVHMLRQVPDPAGDTAAPRAPSFGRLGAILGRLGVISGRLGVFSGCLGVFLGLECGNALFSCVFQGF